jgi:small multidrug resistance family-3 protein
MISFLTIGASLIAATALETTGDAVIRIGLFERFGAARAGVLLGGGLLLLGYGVMLNLAPLPFARVAGLYIATLFAMWQIVSFAAFRAVPTPPILVGGALIVAGGLIVSFWGTQPGP